MDALNRLIFITFFIRFWMENYLQLFMSTAIEIKEIPTWKLMNRISYTSLMSIGIVLNVIYLILWIALMSVFIVFFHWIGKRSVLAFMKIDMNTWNRFLPLMYYIDFFGFRSIIILLFGLSNVLSSKLLWFLLLGFYLSSLLVNILWIY